MKEQITTQILNHLIVLPVSLISLLTAGSPLDSTIDGFAWSVLTLVVWLWTPAFFKKFTLLSVVVALLDLGLPFITLTDLGVLPKSLSVIAAWSLLAAGLVAVYLGAGTVVNGAYGKKVYPMP
jgi:succinate-acetate transporter protein